MSATGVVPSGGAPSRRTSSGVVEGVLLAMVVVWALNGVLLKGLLGVFPPVALSALRFSFIAVVAYALLAAFPARRIVRRSDVPRLVAAALLGVTVYQVLLMEALKRTGVFAANLLQATEPLFALFLLRITGAETVTTRQWAGVGTAFLGTLVFFLEDAPRGATRLGLGDLLNVAAALTFAVYTQVTRPLFVRYPSRVVMAHTMGLGAAPLALFAAGDLARLDWRGVSAAAWAGAGASALFAAYLGFWTWNWAVGRAGVARASGFILLEPLCAAVFAWMLLGESFGPVRLSGAGLTLLGLRLARQTLRS